MLSFPFLTLLLIMAIAGEMFLLLGRDSLSAKHRRATLEAKLKDVQLEIQLAQSAQKAARSSLTEAFDVLESSRAQAGSIDDEVARQQQVDPVLVHTLGVRSKGLGCFRAVLGKTLAAESNEAQFAIWGRANYVDAWAPDPDAALQLARRTFAAEQGYSIAVFAPHSPTYLGDDA